MPVSYVFSTFLADPAMLWFGSGSGEILKSVIFIVASYVLDNFLNFCRFNCSGSESVLLDCNADTDTSDCSHTQDVGVSCLSGKIL